MNAKESTLSRAYNKIFKNKFAKLVFFAIVVFDAVAVFSLLGAKQSPAEIYFLNVGQGDASLVNLHGLGQVLIDGGPPQGGLTRELPKILPFFDRYIDVVFLSHPQLDHFGGLYDLLTSYRIGAFLFSGDEGGQAFQEFINLVNKSETKIVLLGKGSEVRIGEYKFRIVHPGARSEKTSPNDSSLVVLFEGDGIRSLFTGDAGFDAEKDFMWVGRIDVLKVGHHGSKYSSGTDFLSVAKPLLGIIEVGKNRYGHPSDEAMGRIRESGALLFRTDKNGTIKVLKENGILKVFAEIEGGV